MSSSSDVPAVPPVPPPSEVTVVPVGMLPWTFREVDSRGRGCGCGQRGVKLGRGSGHGHMQSRFNEYVVLPSSSVPSAHESVKFSSLSCGLLTSRQTVFKDSVPSYVPSYVATDLSANIGNYDHPYYDHSLMDEDTPLEADIGDQAKRDRTPAVRAELPTCLAHTYPF